VVYKNGLFFAVSVTGIIGVCNVEGPLVFTIETMTSDCFYLLHIVLWGGHVVGHSILWRQSGASGSVPGF